MTVLVELELDSESITSFNYALSFFFIIDSSLFDVILMLRCCCNIRINVLFRIHRQMHSLQGTIDHSHFPLNLLVVCLHLVKHGSTVFKSYYCQAQSQLQFQLSWLYSHVYTTTHRPNHPPNRV